MSDEKYANLTRGGTPACRQFERELADYLEGESRPAVLAHARECIYCGVVLQDLQAVIYESRAFPLVDPPDRVWANIRATLVEEGVIREPRSALRRWLAPLAGVWRPAPVVALVGMIVLAVTLTVSRRAPNPNSTPNPSVASSANETVASVGVSSENVALAQTVQGMERDYQSHKTMIEPALQATYEKSLASLNDSIRQCQDSIQQEPDNALAHQYLMAAYQQKAEVLSAALEYDVR